MDRRRNNEETFLVPGIDSLKFYRFFFFGLRPVKLKNIRVYSGVDGRKRTNGILYLLHVPSLKAALESLHKEALNVRIHLKIQIHYFKFQLFSFMNHISMESSLVT